MTTTLPADPLVESVLAAVDELVEHQDDCEYDRCSRITSAAADCFKVRQHVELTIELALAKARLEMANGLGGCMEHDDDAEACRVQIRWLDKKIAALEARLAETPTDVRVGGT